MSVLYRKSYRPVAIKTEESLQKKDRRGRIRNFRFGQGKDVPYGIEGLAIYIPTDRVFLVLRLSAVL